MENTNENEKLEQEATVPETSTYVPRPAWQVWAARVGLVLFILFVIYQYVKIYRGGL
jgi:hypothetical protein